MFPEGSAPVLRWPFVARTKKQALSAALKVSEPSTSLTDSSAIHGGVHFERGLRFGFGQTEAGTVAEESTVAGGQHRAAAVFTVEWMHQDRATARSVGRG